MLGVLDRAHTTRERGVVVGSGNPPARLLMMMMMPVERLPFASEDPSNLQILRE